MDMLRKYLFRVKQKDDFILQRLLHLLEQKQTNTDLFEFIQLFFDIFPLYTSI